MITFDYAGFKHFVYASRLTKENYKIIRECVLSKKFHNFENDNAVWYSIFLHADDDVFAKIDESHLFAGGYVEFRCLCYYDLIDNGALFGLSEQFASHDCYPMTDSEELIADGLIVFPDDFSYSCFWRGLAFNYAKQ